MSLEFEAAPRPGRTAPVCWKRRLIHPAEFPIDQLLAECSVRRTRRSGPGGQHRNKVETAVVISHGPTGITAEASERRSQNENRRAAIHRLRIKLAVAVRCDRNVPTALWKSRVANRRIRVRQSHEDFPALLAAALDVLEAFGGDVARAAECLSVSNSQLVKFLQTEPTAMRRVHAERERRGQPRLQ